MGVISSVKLQANSVRRPLASLRCLLPSGSSLWPLSLLKILLKILCYTREDFLFHFKGEWPSGRQNFSTNLDFLEDNAYLSFIPLEGRNGSHCNGRDLEKPLVKQTSFAMPGGRFPNMPL